MNFVSETQFLQNKEVNFKRTYGFKIFFKKIILQQYLIRTVIGPIPTENTAFFFFQNYERILFSQSFGVLSLSRKTSLSSSKWLMLYQLICSESNEREKITIFRILFLIKEMMF